MDRQKALVPYNFTNHDKKVLDFIMRTFAGQKDIQFTFFHAYTPLPEIDTDSNAVLGRLRDTMRSLYQEIKDQELILKQVKQDLLAKGFLDDQVDYIFRSRGKEVEDEIIDTAREGHYDLVILSHRHGKIVRLFGHSVSGKILTTMKDIAVCIVN
ncbi:MAG: universal stress protein [Deltaproteobacteria bacterium]|nr:universal stress protein [Deltaproteobacteria bacterium]